MPRTTQSPAKTRQSKAAAESTRSVGSARNKNQTDALLAADSAWLRAYQAKDVSAAVGFYDRKGALLTPNRPPITGASALKKFIASSFRLPEYQISWHANRVEVAGSGDLGYISGVYEMSFRPPRRKLFWDKGKYLMLWRKQKDGSWKVLFDTSSSDLPIAK